MSWWGTVQLLGIQKVIKEGRNQQNSILHCDFVKVISTHPLLRSLLFSSPPAPGTFYYRNPGSPHVNGEVNFLNFLKMQLGIFGFLCGKCIEEIKSSKKKVSQTVKRNETMSAKLHGLLWLGEPTATFWSPASIGSSTKPSSVRGDQRVSAQTLLKPGLIPGTSTAPSWVQNDGWF